MAEYIEREATCKGCVRYGIGETLCADCVVKVAPAADVAPVVHAKWIDSQPDVPNYSYRKSGMSYFCSNCKHRAGKYKHDTYKYCPWCGARMDGE